MKNRILCCDVILSLIEKQVLFSCVFQFGHGRRISFEVSDKTCEGHGDVPGLASETFIYKGAYEKRGMDLGLPQQASHQRPNTHNGFNFGKRAIMREKILPNRIMQRPPLVNTHRHSRHQNVFTARIKIDHRVI